MKRSHAPAEEGEEDGIVNSKGPRRDDGSGSSGIQVCSNLVATIPGTTAPQRVQIRADHDSIVLNSPYSSTRASYGWGDLFRPPLKASISATDHSYYHGRIHIGLSSLNAVPAVRSDRAMPSLMRTYRRKFSTLEHCYPYHKVGDAEAWKGWADMVKDSNKLPQRGSGTDAVTDNVSGSTACVSPSRFIFTVKANNYLTHVKRLEPDADVAVHVSTFFHERTRLLGVHEGPVLLQLPPSLQYSAANRERLVRLDAMLPADEVEHVVLCADCLAGKDSKECAACVTTRRRRVRIAVEFRHRSWYNAEVLSTLRQLKWSLVVAHHFDDTTFAKHVDTGTDYMYVRLHGCMGAYVGDYGPERMRQWAEMVVAFIHDGQNSEIRKNREVFFFLNNNDSHIGGLTSSVVDATCLAQEIQKLLAQTTAPPPPPSPPPPLPATTTANTTTVVSDDENEVTIIDD